MKYLDPSSETRITSAHDKCFQCDADVDASKAEKHPFFYKCLCGVCMVKNKTNILFPLISKYVWVTVIKSKDDTTL